MRLVESREFKKEILKELLRRGKSDLSAIESSVKTIIADVRKQGDEALLHYTEKFDKITLTTSKLRVTEEEISEAYKQLNEAQIAALREAAANIAGFHKNQLREKWTVRLAEGVTLGQIMRPLQSVGVYVPGGRGSYPSSVLMGAVPAKVAGVERVVVCSPPQRIGDVDPALLVAADVAGVDEVYRVGGVQAIAAMAYGTGTVEKVDKIVGPGNVYVTAAKLAVSRDVAIDVPAGPSEVLIIADETGNPSFIASDLLAQAEHDPQAWAILITSSPELASAVKDEVYKQLQSLSRAAVINSSITERGLIVTVASIEEAVDYANLIAPEHLEIQTRNPMEVLDKIRNAGAIFLGLYSPVAFGDYSSGLNHVLPTAGYARIYSGLSALDFVKTMNFVECSREGYRKLRDTAVVLAEMEGFDAHAKSVSIREEREDNEA